jgi:hypothetical protein
MKSVFRKYWILNISQPYRPPRSAMAIALFFICRWCSYLTGNTGHHGFLRGQFFFFTNSPVLKAIAILLSQDASSIILGRLMNRLVFHYSFHKSVWTTPFQQHQCKVGFVMAIRQAKRLQNNFVIRNLTKVLCDSCGRSKRVYTNFRTLFSSDFSHIASLA